MKRLLLAGCALIGLARSPAWAAAGKPEDSCVHCHRNAQESPALEHNFADWEKSIHGKAGIACHSCHGGDSAEAGKAAAHAGLRPSSDPQSPVYFTNIPETCGACHEPEFKAFKKSRHYKELESSGRGPNCVTCHGSMANHVIAPREMEMTCTLCHRKPTQAFSSRMSIEEVRVLLHRLDKELERARRENPALDLAVQERTRQALRDRFNELLVNWHSFEMAKMREQAQAIAKEASAAFTELKFKTRKP